MPEIRRAFFELLNHDVPNPVVIKRQYPALSPAQTQLYAATDVGGLLLDGLGDGVVLSTELLPERAKSRVADDASTSSTSSASASCRRPARA